METQASICAFWFGSERDDAVAAEAQAGLWWAKRADTDAEIQRRFEPCVVAARSGELDGWRGSATGVLALILVTDQFPRNIYRDTPGAFACDHLARTLCGEGLAIGTDKALRPIERVFFYLPLEHSEGLEDQQRSVALYGELAADAPPAAKSVFDGFLDFAVRHQVIIERFGRFPHRNAILGRESTPEEIAFLQGPESSF